MKKNQPDSFTLSSPGMDIHPLPLREAVLMALGNWPISTIKDIDGNDVTAKYIKPVLNAKVMVRVSGCHDLVLIPGQKLPETFIVDIHIVEPTEVPA